MLCVYLCLHLSKSCGRRRWPCCMRLSQYSSSSYAWCSSHIGAAAAAMLSRLADRSCHLLLERNTCVSQLPDDWRHETNQTLNVMTDSCRCGCRRWQTQRWETYVAAGNSLSRLKRLVWMEINKVCISSLLTGLNKHHLTQLSSGQVIPPPALCKDTL